MLAFESHARFYSRLTDRAPAIDPQVFVRDDASEAGNGPQGIEHERGFRPARTDDPPELAAYDADGEQLLFTLGKWFGASGTARIEPDGAGDRVTVDFAHLIPCGVYSLFEVAFARGSTTVAPLDGTGEHDGFIAGVDGDAHFVVSTPAHIASGNAIVLVYHSDALDHGLERGELGLTAHQELAARLP
jgi:hypothetical protein